MKRKYIGVELEISLFDEEEDIITLSIGIDGGTSDREDFGAQQGDNIFNDW